MFKIKSDIGRIRGFRVAGVHAGLKKNNALDFALIASDRDCVTAGVFTSNKVKAAPVLLNQHRLKSNPSKIRAVAVNTKSANACTGQKGYYNAEKMSALVAEALNCKSEQVLVMSTGVIGTHLPMDKIAHGVELASDSLRDDWESTATAIMTTDTKPKFGSIQVLTANGNYTIAGICKGSGMIAPNMATMLGIFVTDARLTPAVANQLLVDASDKSFNRIVVDGDTSTNDMVVMMANGASQVAIETDADIKQFRRLLTLLSQSLARKVVRDGEGATKFITLDIRNAESEADAKNIGHTIATSALTKTAFYGSDANWGRIVASAGRANVPFNPDTTSLWISPSEMVYEDDLGLLIFQNGTPSDYFEREASAIMKEESIYITLDCGLGDGQATIWTCDLSHEYVTINADYRT